MDESRRARSSYQSIQDYIDPVLNSISRKLLTLAFYAVQGVVTTVLITLISIFTYLIFYRRYVPHPIIQKTIYFNFNHDPPIATVNLLSGERMDAHTYNIFPHTSTPAKPDFSRLLKPDYKYTFDITVELAKSQRNYEIGKFVLSADFIDTTGGVRGHAYHPIVMPYESGVHVFLESLVLFPARLLRFIPTTETIVHTFTLVNPYTEPSSLYPPTDAIQLSLSTRLIDIQAMHMNILPQLRGLVWCMYYYPYTSMVVGVGILWALQMGVVMMFVMGKILYHTLRHTPNALPTQTSQTEGISVRGEESNDQRREGRHAYVVEDSHVNTPLAQPNSPISPLNTLRQRKGRSVVPTRLENTYNRVSLQELMQERDELKKDNASIVDTSLLESKND